MAGKHTSEQGSVVDPTDWVDQYGNVLMSYALARLRSHELAEDLVQETFLVAWKSYDKFDQRSRFSTWLVAILRRKIADYYRTAGRDIAPLDQEEIDKAAFTRWGKWASKLSAWRGSPDKVAENREFWNVFASCLAAMPAHLNYVYRLRELRATATDELSKVLAISPANVLVRLHRARLLMRQCLDEKWFQEK